MNKSTKGFFDPKTAFFSLPIVKWTIMIGIILIIIVFIFIVISSPRDIDTSADGFNEFLEMIKFPIFLLGFFAALLALFATNHRSEQNKAAMNLAEEQNRFSNYYKHIEEYENYIEKHIKDKIDPPIPTVRIRKLHKALYNNAKKDGLTFSPEIENTFLSLVEDLAVILINTDFNDKNDVINILEKTHAAVVTLYELLNNSISFSNHSNEIRVSLNRYEIRVPDAVVFKFLKSHIIKMKISNEILSFDENFDSNQFIEQLIEGIDSVITTIPHSIKIHNNADVVFPESSVELKKQLINTSRSIENLMIAYNEIRLNRLK